MGQLRITVTKVDPPAAEPGETVTLEYKLENTGPEPECYSINLWWRQEKIAGDKRGGIEGNDVIYDTFTFTMPDKPEDPTLLSLNVYRCAWYPFCNTPLNPCNPAPDDFDVFQVEKIEPRPERGFKVIIHEPPPAGKVVLYILTWPSKEIPIDEKPVNSQTESVFLDASLTGPYEPVIIRLLDETGYKLDEKTSKSPETGVRVIDMYGYNGAHYMTRVYTDTTTVQSGKPFKVYAKLYQVPKKPLDEGYEVNFYVKRADVGDWKYLGTNITNEDGVAVLQTTLTLEPGEEQAEYVFSADYDEEPTYSDPCMVTVVPAPPGGGAGGDIIQIIAQLFGVSEEQARLIIIGFVVLLLLLAAL
ncbi:MAG: hypothetical protein DRJ03_28145 [Chloroflexi bacterium]|nr:MAG: hypothetical protein DRJ03_28145 [Chloroflexota bacterium]